MVNSDVKKQLKMHETDYKATAFSLVSMNTDDAEAYLPKKLKERFFRMTFQQQIQFMSMLMDKMNEVFEENNKYGFGRLLKYTLSCLKKDGEVESLFEEAQKVKDNTYQNEIHAFNEASGANYSDAGYTLLFERNEKGTKVSFVKYPNHERTKQEMDELRGYVEKARERGYYCEF